MLAEYRRVVNELHDTIHDYYMIYNKGAKKIDEYNLTVQQENMMLFIMRNQRITANEIALKFSISKSAVSQVLAKLEERDFIVRESNPNNRREALITLGEEGKKFADLIDKADEDFVQKYCSRIGIEDLKQVVDTMKKINGAIADSEEKKKR
ncbi:MarR family winged helix-turn-helix transcriptional regulator [Brevibacillus sp. B_LB10_24]|uniref:MarR family winged helix-turn-helix transcriptional regulator n=1 Tax=Brevibacillus sp. B_LB10_24 TaxID=3380645 RepID=UPI0038B744ED